MCGKCHYCQMVCWQLPFVCNIRLCRSSALLSRHRTYVSSMSESKGVGGGEVAQRGLFAGTTHWLPFPCPSIKQPQCVMLKPEAGRDMLLFQPFGFPSVKCEGRSEGRGSERKQCVPLSCFQLLLGCLKPFILLLSFEEVHPPHWGFSPSCPREKEWKC